MTISRKIRRQKDGKYYYILDGRRVFLDITKQHGVKWDSVKIYKTKKKTLQMLTYYK